MAWDRNELRFWRAVAVRLLAIVLLGWLTILWFQGCLVPQTRDEMRQDRQKALGTEAPR